MKRILSKFISPGKSYFLILAFALLIGCSIMKRGNVMQVPLQPSGVEYNKPDINNVYEGQLTPPVVQPREKIKVALLLPLSGKSQKLGEAMLDAAQLAANDIGNNSLAIVPIDTSDSQISAMQAVNKALDEKVSIILGPLYSNATAAIAPVAAQNNINVISFSNDKSLKDSGVFLLGFMPDQQVNRVVKYAYGRGITSYSSFVPQNDFGKLVTDELNGLASQYTLKLESMGSYLSGDSGEQVDVTKAIQVRAESTGAVLIPEGGNRLQEIISVMQKNNSTKEPVKFLGSGQWDDPAVLKIKGLSGSWFASSPPTKRQQFEERFNQIYGYTPPRITSLAYDAIALAAYLAQTNGDFSRTAITNPRGFMALNGIFRFNDEGVCERGLSVIEIRSNRFIEVDPAPRSFANY